MNTLKAAASPMRKHASFEDAAGSSPSSNPKTPRRSCKENDLDGGVMMVGGTAVTPMKRVPILANFEEWMKMATDNKINAANSWNFALIDYFHDMSLLKEGDGVNFQKASCTLDGCVKIYTSRVDSVATETGKLLSGLADSGNNKKKRGEDEEGEESEEEVEDEDGVVRKKPKKRVRTFYFLSLNLAVSDGLVLLLLRFLLSVALRTEACMVVHMFNCMFGIMIAGQKKVELLSHPG
jgi:condensin complex subunit 2